MLNHSDSAIEDPAAIVSSRRFAVTAQRLFGALSDPAQLLKWWGPEGFTCTFEEFDFRVGGAWRFNLHAPDGATYLNRKHFVEIAPLERVVLRHEQEGHDFTMTMTIAPDPAIEPSGEASLLTWCLRFDSLEEAQRLREIIAGANEQNFDRLEAHLTGAS